MHGRVRLPHAPFRAVHMTDVLPRRTQVAIATGRTPVWPDVPCSAPWVAEGGPQGAASLPLDIRMVRAEGVHQPALKGAALQHVTVCRVLGVVEVRLP